MNMNVLKIERTFDAPIEKIWAAWTTPELLAQWFAPAGMENTLATAEVKEGGLFRFCFSDQEGNDYFGRGRYEKIKPMTYLSYYDSFTDKDGKDIPAHGKTELEETLVEIHLEEAEGKTKMTIVMENPYHDDQKTTDEMVSGWNSMFDKLNGATKEK